jgi:hypothetical protein
MAQNRGDDNWDNNNWGHNDDWGNHNDDWGNHDNDRGDHDNDWGRHSYQPCSWFPWGWWWWNPCYGWWAPWW